jgi:hypothetical protein
MRNTVTRWVVTAADAPVLVFESAGAGCHLREMWNRADSAAYVFPGSRSGSPERRASVITLAAVRAD